MRQWFSIIFASLRFMLGLWLIVNVSIATIPRCDQLLDLLLKALPDDSQLVHQHDTVHCDPSSPESQGPQLGADTLCRCSLAHFTALELPQVATEAEALPVPPVLFLIAFSYRLRALDYAAPPMGPPPRLVIG